MKDLTNSKIPRLFELMKSKGVTAAALARSLKISQGNVTDWKMGRAAPSAGVMTAVADYLGTTPEYLRGETDDPSPANGKDSSVNSDTSASSVSSDNSVNSVSSDNSVNSGDFDALTEQEKLIVKIFRKASLEDKFRMITAMMTIANKTPGAVPGTSLAAFGGGNSAEPPIDDIVIT